MYLGLKRNSCLEFNKGKRLVINISWEYCKYCKGYWTLLYSEVELINELSSGIAILNLYYKKNKSLLQIFFVWEALRRMD